MKDKIFPIKRPGTPTLLSALTVCLLLFFIIQYGLYAKQNTALAEKNEALSSALADREQAIDARDQTITEKTQETGKLRAQLTEAASIKEQETETGFVKKGSFYLINEVSQLKNLQSLIENDRDIEPGVPAATASYRLRNDLVIDYYDYGVLSLGTEENPFYGSFDGDGHSLEGAFPLMDGKDVPESLFCADKTAKIENLHIVNQMSHYYELGGLSDCEDLKKHLPGCAGHRVSAEISSWDLDVREAAEALRAYWERNENKDGACVSMVYNPKSDSGGNPPADLEKYISNLHTALTTLAGAEYTRIIEDTMAEETGYLCFVRLERIGGLTCCIFETGMPDEYYRVSENYYIIAEGSWEGKETARQCLSIPYTSGNFWSIGTCPYFRPEPVDLNFDGKQDLLIHEGGSGGSGGSWSHYRAVVWKEDGSQFACYPSFPAYCVSLEFDRQRVVNHYRSGASCECVEVYGVVNGEYTCTRKLVLQSKLQGDEYVEELLYYEMGELVETHVLSGDWYEKVDLYPDMNYWSKG